MYREVLRSSEEHKDRLKTDSLQVRRRRSSVLTDSHVLQSNGPVLHRGSTPPTT